MAPRDYVVYTLLLHVDVDSKLHNVPGAQFHGSTLLAGRTQTVLIHKRAIAALGVFDVELRTEKVGKLGFNTHGDNT